MSSTENCKLTFSPSSLLRLNAGDSAKVQMSLMCKQYASYKFNIISSDNVVAKIISSSIIQMQSQNQNVSNILTVDAKDFGIANIQFNATALNGSSPLSVPNIPVSVLKVDSIWDWVITFLIATALATFNLGFGCTLHWGLLIDIIKKPIGPVIGMVCQFLCMPIFAFSISSMLGLEELSGLGLVIIGSCPGGGVSNALTYLLDGDLELSILMSAMSTITATVATPFWIWMFSPYFTQTLTVQVPLSDVVMTILIIVIPISIGAAINANRPAWSKVISASLRPAIYILGGPLLLTAFLAYSSVVARTTLETFIACAIIPAAGFIFGFSAGYWILKDVRKSTTICIDTGIQSTSLALLIVNVSLPSPESDLASQSPVVYTCTSIAYPTIIISLMSLYKCISQPNINNNYK